MNLEPIPRIIYLGTDVRKQILDEFPEIEPIVSSSLTKDTVMCVRQKYSVPYVKAEDDESKGILFTNPGHFKEVLKHFFGFTSAFANGKTLKESVDQFVNKLGGEGVTKWQ